AATPETRRHARTLLGLPENATVVGTAARLSHQKAPLDMVHALARLGRPDVTFAWIGDGELRSRTEREIRRAGLEGRFLLLGERSYVPALLPAFDGFALPSLYEGLPCAVVEAMTSGIPVVATAVNSVPEIVIAGRTGLLARPGDPRAWPAPSGSCSAIPPRRPRWRPPRAHTSGAASGPRYTRRIWWWPTTWRSTWPADAGRPVGRRDASVVRERRRAGRLRIRAALGQRPRLGR